MKTNTDKLFIMMCKSALVLYPLLFMTISYILYDMVSGSGYTAELILNISGHGEQRTTHIMDVWVFPLMVVKPWFMAILFSYGIWGYKRNDAYVLAQVTGASTARIPQCTAQLPAKIRKHDEV